MDKFIVSKRKRETELGVDTHNSSKEPRCLSPNSSSEKEGLLDSAPDKAQDSSSDDDSENSHQELVEDRSTPPIPSTRDYPPANKDKNPEPTKPRKVARQIFDSDSEEWDGSSSEDELELPPTSGKPQANIEEITVKVPQKDFQAIVLNIEEEDCDSLVKYLAKNRVKTLPSLCRWYHSRKYIIRFLDYKSVMCY